ncbi:hypothetical protein [Streptomyces nodosus]|uniref:hypothetical protein n=1 Tax=Streptomyces nodosus TaxID=40318 RepID=UPI003826ED3D
MSAHVRRRMRWGAPAATAAALALLVGCSHGSSEGSDKLSVSGLRDKARAAAEDATNCPVHYDVSRAAAKADVTGTAEPGEVSAELDDHAEKDEPIATFKGAVLECAYQLAGEPVTVESIAVERGRAVNLMAPKISADAGLGIDPLKTYLDKVAKADLNAPVLTESGNVASIGLPVDGKGDIALVVTFGENQHTRLSSHQVSVMTAELAGQAKW